MSDCDAVSAYREKLLSYWVRDTNSSLLCFAAVSKHPVGLARAASGFLQQCGAAARRVELPDSVLSRPSHIFQTAALCCSSDLENPKYSQTGELLQPFLETIFSVRACVLRGSGLMPHMIDRSIELFTNHFFLSSHDWCMSLSNYCLELL